MFFGEQPANSSFPLNRFLKPDCGTKSATSWLQSGRQSLANRVCSAERVVSCPISTSTGPSGPIMLHHQSDSDDNGHVNGKRGSVDASVDPNNPMNDWKNDFNAKDALAGIFGAGGNSIWDSKKDENSNSKVSDLWASNTSGSNSAGMNKSSNGLASIW